MRFYCFKFPKSLPLLHSKIFAVTVGLALTFLISVVLWRKNLDSDVPTTRHKPYVKPPLYACSHSAMPVPSVILRPISNAGIGDQLFRFAYAYAAARDLNTTLYVAIRPNELISGEFGPHDRSFALNNFRLESTRVKYITEATLNAIPDDRKFLLDELGPWRPAELPRNTIVVVTEFWQSDMYFGRYRSELMEQFVPRNSVLEKPRLSELVTEIKQSESVAVHVRRCDFQGSWLGAAVSSPHHRVLNISYQLKAMELVQYLLDTRREPSAGPRASWRPLTFFVFSDDIEFTHQEMVGVGAKLVFVSTPDKKLDSIEEFELMCLCRHQIIPNSGFSCGRRG